MKRIVISALMAGGTILTSTPAAAQSTETAPDWSGFYVGVQAAYHFGEVEDSECTGLCADDNNVENGYLALQAGYDAHVGDNLVVGPMGWLGITPVEEETQLTPTITIRGKTKFAGFLGVRAGVDAGSVLPYAFVGYEHVKLSVVNDGAPIPKNKRSHDGIGLGAGAEFRVARAFSVDARYMYSDLGNEDYNFGGGPTPYGERSHTVSLGVNYRF